MPKYRFTLHMGIVGAAREDEYEIDAEDLEGLSEEERNKILNEHWQEWAWNYLDGGWEEVEGE